MNESLRIHWLSMAMCAVLAAGAAPAAFAAGGDPPVSPTAATDVAAALRVPEDHALVLEATVAEKKKHVVRRDRGLGRANRFWLLI